MKHRIRKSLCALLALALLFGLAACGEDNGSHRVKGVLTLVEQAYSLAFRNDDPLQRYLVAAIEELNAEGTVDELSRKWFGKKIIEFGKKENALAALGEIPAHKLLVGVDINSFPMAYVQDGNYWGFDVELATLACEKLGWELQILSIEKENVYIELYSGNIDVAWGGVALSQAELDAGAYTQYGPYVDNDIVVIARDGSVVKNSSKLSGKTLAMPTTPEAMEALDGDPKLKEKLGQIMRLPGGTAECFAALYAGDCDAVLTDSTAMYYYNSH
ncbi:MAG: transporter substrate-binding domain-containing protein [Oscillospiraceae bacterium]|nr:transporter substrate-binding domain-containing protein [Oscillospiraceae bacterium]